MGLLGYGLTSTPRDASVDEALRRGDTLAAPGFELAALHPGSPGRLAPDWNDAAADGRVRLDEHDGTPVALSFWASWCDPCRAEIRVLERRGKVAERQGILALGINQQDTREDPLAFLAERGVTFFRTSR